MKKVLFTTLAIAVAMTGFAQRPVMQKSSVADIAVKRQKTIVQDDIVPPMSFNGEVMTKATTVRATNEWTEYETMATYYDLQSNSMLGNRIATWQDGSVAAVATWDFSGSTSWPDRGTGYNYFDGEDWGDWPEENAEGFFSGWPAIAPLGNGEILASHGGGNINIFKREVKGEGDWEQVATIEGATWPRIATTGNGQYVHVICCESVEETVPEFNNPVSRNEVYYSRSTDGGQTFSAKAFPPEVDVAGIYNKDIAADDYVMATNGNTIAILFGSTTFELFYIISRDNGETWEKQVVAPFPYGNSIYWGQTAITNATDSIWSCDNSASIAIDNEGTVHVAFGLTRWAPAPYDDAGNPQWGYYSYWPYTQGLVYWNSKFTNEQGGHEIPLFGDWSGDNALIEADPTYTLNGTNGISNTLNVDRLWEMADAYGGNDLYVFGFLDEDGNDTIDSYAENWGDNSHAIVYRTFGIATQPAISVDDNGNVMILFNVLSQRLHPQQTFYYRSAYVTCRDYTGTWFENAYNLTGDLAHSRDEVYYTTVNPNALNGSFWGYYFADANCGLQLDGDNNGTITENTMRVVKITPDMEGWGVKDNEAVNPMTATRVYPNPATDVLNIEVNASQASEMNISVFNITGQKVIEKNVNISTGINVPSVSTSSLTSGIYFVTVKANGFENTMKFIVK